MESDLWSLLDPIDAATICKVMQSALGKGLVEKKIMGQHSIYWKETADRGIALIYKPVLDPKGAYRLGILDPYSV